MVWWAWGPLGILDRHEKRLDDLHRALSGHVTANISRLELVERQQKELSVIICTHKDQNAQQLDRIGKIVTDLDKRLRGHTWMRTTMVVYRILVALACLLGVVVGGMIVWKRPDSLPYIAQIFASALTKH